MAVSSVFAAFRPYTTSCYQLSWRLPRHNTGAACVWYFQIGLGLQTVILAGMVVVAIFFSLPYLIDRLISPHFTGSVRTLIFPLSFVAVDYLKTLLYPFGSVGSLAFTQCDNLPLLQLVAIKC